MKVKIFDTVYDTETQPIMIILTNQDKENINNMLPEATKYCGYPSGMNQAEVLEWMKKDVD